MIIGNVFFEKERKRLADGAVVIYAAVIVEGGEQRLVDTLCLQEKFTLTCDTVGIYGVDAVFNEIGDSIVRLGEFFQPETEKKIYRIQKFLRGFDGHGAAHAVRVSLGEKREKLSAAALYLDLFADGEHFAVYGGIHERQKIIGFAEGASVDFALVFGKIIRRHCRPRCPSCRPSCGRLQDYPFLKNMCRRGRYVTACQARRFQAGRNRRGRHRQTAGA